MTPTEEAHLLTHCARAACQVFIGTAGYSHKHDPHRRYCLRCARRINDACPEDPPFDLSAVPRIRTTGERNPDGCLEMDFLNWMDRRKR